MEKKKTFYGTWIVAASFLIMGGVVGIAWNCNSLFVKAICEDTGYSRSQIVLLTTILSATTMVMSLFINKIYAKVKPASIMKITTITLPIFYFCISFCHSLWQFYAVQICVALSLFLSSNVPLSLIIGNWYKKNYGTMLGFAFMGSGIVGMVFNSLVGQLLPVYGWRFTYRVLAVCIAILIVPVTWFVIKNAPEDKGMMAFGADEEGEKKDEPVWGPTFAEAIKTPTFILVCVAMFCSMTALNTQIQTVSPRLTDLGYSVSMASNISALGLGSLALGKVLLGRMYDRMSVRMATCIATVLGILALLGEVFAGITPMVALIVLGEGISCAMGTVGMPVFVKGLYGNRDYNSIYGKMMAIGNCGGMLGPLFVNAMYDAQGSYDTALMICTAMAVVALVIYIKVLGTNGEKN